MHPGQTRAKTEKTHEAHHSLHVKSVNQSELVGRSVSDLVGESVSE